MSSHLKNPMKVAEAGVPAEVNCTRKNGAEGQIIHGTDMGSSFGFAVTD